MTYTREQIEAELARRSNEGSEDPEEASTFTREQIEAELERRDKTEKKDHGLIGRGTGMALRSAASIPGSILDLPLLAYNLPRAVYQGFNPDAPDRTFSLSEMTKKGIDKLTNNEYAPQTNTEKNIVAAGEAIIPMGFLGKTSKLTKHVPGLIQKAFKPTAANIAGTGAGAAAAQQALNIDPEAMGTALAAGVLTGSVANKAARGVQSGVHALKHGAPWDDYFARAAIRHKPIGTKLISDIPGQLGGATIESMTPHETGKYATKGIDQYKSKASNLFNKLENKLDSYVSQHVSKDNPNRFVSIEKPMEWALEEYNKIETPALKQMFLDSPVGKYLQNLGFNTSENISTDIKIPYNDLLGFRKELDNSISTFGQIGSIDQGKLKTLRGKISEEVGNKIKDMGPKPYHIWKKFNRAYELYADKRIPMINKISDEKNFPTKAYLKSTQDIGEGAATPEVIINSLKGPHKEKYTLGLFRELGMKAGEVHPGIGVDDLPRQKFDLPTFFQNFTSLKPEEQKIYMSGLSNPMKQNIKKQLKLYHGYQDLLRQEETLADLLYRKPSLHWAAKAKKIITRRTLGAKWQTEEGQKKLINTLQGITRPKIDPQEIGSLKQAAVTLTPWMLNKRS